jgi:hypothetical protein
MIMAHGEMNIKKRKHHFNIQLGHLLFFIPKRTFYEYTVCTFYSIKPLPFFQHPSVNDALEKRVHLYMWCTGTNFITY